MVKYSFHIKKLSSRGYPRGAWLTDVNLGLSVAFGNTIITDVQFIIFKHNSSQCTQFNTIFRQAITVQTA